MKNKLTLKSLKDQIDNLSALKKAEKAKTDKKQEVSVTMKSSFIYMYLFSWIAFLANKLPFTSKLTSMLKLYYGRTSIWRMLVLARKAFIVFNAIIGVIAVLKLTGMSYGSFLSNFVMMGTTYVDIFQSFIRKLFNWIFDFFDYKVVPNVPNNNTSWWPGPKAQTWHTNPMVKNDIMEIAKLKDMLPSPLNSSTTHIDLPWYKDWYNWVWYGSALVGLVSIGVLAYIGYTNYYDIIADMFPFQRRAGNAIDPTGGTANNNIAGNAGGNPILPPVNPEAGDPLINFAAIGNSISNGFSSVRDTTTRVLNPFNWFSSERTVEESRRLFMDLQNSVNTQDTRYYPFTPNDPYASWLERLRLSWLGENIVERSTRLRARAYAWREMSFNATQVGMVSGAQTPIHTSFNTPVNLGLNLRLQSVLTPSGIIGSNPDFVRAAEAFRSVPQTPTMIPTIVIPLDRVDESLAEWASQSSNSPVASTSQLEKIPVVDNSHPPLANFPDDYFTHKVINKTPELTDQEVALLLLDFDDFY